MYVMALIWLNIIQHYVFIMWAWKYNHGMQSPTHEDSYSDWAPNMIHIHAYIP